VRRGRPRLTSLRGSSKGRRVDATPNPSEEAVLTEARRIVQKVLGQHAVRIFLCGSRARGHAAPQSDIDIAVLPLRPLPPDALSDLREALEESTIPYDVDIIDLSAVDESFRNKVLSEGVAWNA
jgi:predicted nucleotidyltransferase